MSHFRNVIFVAALAGLVAGLAMAALQAFATTPLILKAETFENASNVASVTPDARTETSTGASANTSVNTSVGESSGGFKRSALTIVANIVTAIGFGIIMVVLSEFAGGLSGWRPGLMWGLAGFASFTLAPGLGLPPELPAMPAGDLVARQSWWLATVAATAGGLALIALMSNGLYAILGVALIIAPHLVGAPQPVDHSSPVPADLHHQFVVMSTLSSLVFWALLGGLIGYFRPRFFDAPSGQNIGVA